MTTQEPRLCYVDGGCAHFTTQPLDKQTGDDWNDAPYEHNAGDPYEWSERDGGPKWEIHRRYWEGSFSTPADDAMTNSRYSVDTINTGAVAWLRLHVQGASHDDHIWAGDTMSEFTRKILAAGGNVYAPVES